MNMDVIKDAFINKQISEFEYLQLIILNEILVEVRVNNYILLDDE